MIVLVCMNLNTPLKQQQNKLAQSKFTKALEIILRKSPFGREQGALDEGSEYFDAGVGVDPSEPFLHVFCHSLPFIDYAVWVLILG